MVNRYAASRGNQVVDIPRNKAAIGDFVKIPVRKIIVACAFALGVVDIDIVITKCYRVVKPRTAAQLIARQSVHAVNHAAFTYTDFGRRV